MIRVVGVLQGPDYRLYKSEPELTTVAEVDESNGDDKIDHTLDMENATNKGQPLACSVQCTVLFE